MIRKEPIKGELHARNPHRQSYDFDSLIEVHEPLRGFVAPNRYGSLSINFFDSAAVLALNTALLKLHYGLEWWEFPSSALIPPIGGRADYIHYAADLVGSDARRVLDVGVGATCIYPIIGRAEYGWEFVGSDISASSLQSSQRIIDHNRLLSGGVELRLQPDREHIFEGVIRPSDSFDLTLCNPPFHASALDAAKGSRRKLSALGAGRSKSPKLNFEGGANELWCAGGERAFVERMIVESRAFGAQCRWFSSLISSEDNLPYLRRAITRCGAREQRTIEMSQGNKRSRILAWRF